MKTVMPCSSHIPSAQHGAQHTADAQEVEMNEEIRTE